MTYVALLFLSLQIAMLPEGTKISLERNLLGEMYYRDGSTVQMFLHGATVCIIELVLCQRNRLTSINVIEVCVCVLCSAVL